VLYFIYITIVTHNPFVHGVTMLFLQGELWPWDICMATLHAAAAAASCHWPAAYG
jgi:hypothetical protein